MKRLLPRFPRQRAISTSQSAGFAKQRLEKIIGEDRARTGTLMLSALSEALPDIRKVIERNFPQNRGNITIQAKNRDNGGQLISISCAIPLPAQNNI